MFSLIITMAVLSFIFGLIAYAEYSKSEMKNYEPSLDDIQNEIATIDKTCVNTGKKRSKNSCPSCKCDF